MSDFNNRQKVYWNKIESYKRMNRNHMKKITKIASLLELKKNDYKKVLEVGVGTGIHAHFLQTFFPKLKLYGVDISEMMINKSKELLGLEVVLKVAEVEKLPFKDDFFDAIYCNATLHHLNNPFQGIKEIIRVLKPRGVFVAMEPNIYFPKNLLQALFIPEERNNFLITKKNYKNWSRKLSLINFSTGYFIYTIPFPKYLFRFYDWLDDFLGCIPFIKKLSIQIFFKTIKPLVEDADD